MCSSDLLDIVRRTLTYTNAGHNPPFLLRGNGECLRLEDGGLVIGGFTDSAYTQREIQLNESDKLVLFTDGVTEARNDSGEEFGEHRLEECLRSYRGRDAAELRTIILDGVTRFCGDNFDDDAALMVMIAE